MNRLLSKSRFCILTLLAIFFANGLSTFAQQKETIAIIDAGSSGSRLFVYEANANEVTCIFPGTIQKDESKGCAISDIAAGKINAEDYLNTMTAKYLPKDSADLYVLATAGMRNVDKNKADSIYTVMKNIKTKNKYRIKESMTISGRYEGLYAWIAANYDTLKTQQTPSELIKKTKGILEIGGASMQITLIPGTDMSATDIVQHKIYGPIYSKSYIHGGVDLIFKNHKEPGTSEYDNNYELSLRTSPPSLLSDKSQPDSIYGLGKPISIAVKGIKTTNYNDYLKSLTAHDSESNYHPKSNAAYINWLITTMNIDINKIILKQDESWTKGAAHDILINKSFPEKFNYDTNNPN